MNKKNKNKIDKNDAKIHLANGTPVIWCLFCGAKVGQLSERTNKEVKSVYYCPTCYKNYCDQCSYSEEINGDRIQLCLRCGSKLEII